MAQKLSDTHLRNAKPRETRYELRDGNGLSLWVYPTGTRAWVYTYTMSGRKRRMTLGQPYPETSLTDARDLHREAHTLVAQGIDPVEHEKAKEEEKQARARAEEAERQAREAAEEARRAEEAARRAEEDLAPTVAKLVDLYLEKWAKPRKRSWAEDQRQLLKDVVPVLGNLKARDVARGHIRELLESVIERGAPVAANRLLAVLQRMFAWAAEKEYVAVSPCLAVKMPSEEPPKDRVLSPEEVRAFWGGMDALPAPVVREGRPRAERREEGSHAVTDAVRRALKLVLATAQRPGEVVGMEWDEIEGSWWTIPAGKAKNKLSHRVHLSKLALELLGPRGEGYVFPSPRKELGHIHRAALAHALRDNRDALGTRDFAPHDLRRTAASLMAGAGVNPFTVERVLNHALQGVQKIYNRHSYDAEKRQALEAWGRKLGRILEGKDGAEVLPLPQRKKNVAEA